MDVGSSTGSVVGGFTVGRLLARGAMGAVYVAEDPAGNRVALKLLSPELARDERFRQRFLRESRLAATLDHPNVVRTLVAGDDGGVLYLAMEHVDGVDLRELLRRERRLAPDRAVAIIAQAADALDAAHDAGLVHRDVKPGNILVQDDQAYVCDFGLARHVSSVGSLTGDRGFVGTVDYVAPEQIRGKSVDGRADVYALGCVLFECLAGARPYDRDTELAVVFAHLNEPPPRLTELQPDLPGAWDGVVARALAKEPSARYATCGALVDAAREALVGRRAKRRAGWPILAVAPVAAVAAGALGAVLVLHHGSPDGASKPAAARPLVLEGVGATTGRTVAGFHAGTQFGYGAAPSDVVATGRSAWLLLPSEQKLLRVDTRTHELISSLALPWVPLPRLAAGDGFVWAAQDGGPELARVSVADGRLDRVRPNDSPSTGIAAGDGSLWVATERAISDVVPENGTSGRDMPYNGSGRLAVGDGALWSLDGLGVIRKLDLQTGRTLARRDLHATVSDVVVAGGLVWAAVVPDGLVYGLDDRDLRVRRTVAVGADPERLSFGGGRLWIANTAAGVVTSLDPRTGERRRFKLGAEPAAAAYGGEVVWAATVPKPPPLPPAGGPELRISLPGDYVTFDPAASHSDAGAQFETATCANLLGYRDRNGSSGKRLVPEVAAAMPQVTNGGRTYTFRIRRGFRFSPPSNEEMTAATFKHSFERLLSPRLGTGGRGPTDAPAIVGLAAFRAGTAAHISGIVASGQTLSITLVRPSGDFLTRISLPHLCPVPLATPTHPLLPGRVVPTSGPYYVSSTGAGRIVLLPNPGYGGQRPQHWARIVYTLGVPTPEAVALVGRGIVDYLPVDYEGDSLLWRRGVLESRYGPASAAARRGGQRYFPTSDSFLDYIVLDATRPLFRNARMRRAVNLALDRPALAASFHDDPADGIVPPAVDGFRVGAEYPLDGPHLAAARMLVGAARRHAVLSYCTFFPYGDDGLRTVAPIVKANLARIGIDVAVVRADECPQRYDAASRRADLLLVTNFGSDVPDPLAFLEPALARGTYGSAFGPGPWNDASFRRRFEAARSLRGASRTAAYVRLERELMHAAPFAVYGTFSFGQYVSPRVGCETTTAADALLDLLALCPRHA